MLATDYEIGFMAIGIGLLVGLSVNILSGKRGVPLQIVAVVAAVAGTLVGTYFTFLSVLRDLVGQEMGAEAAAGISMFSPAVAGTFVASPPSGASPFDILWIVLAVVAGWRIPKGLGLKSTQPAS